MSKVSIIVPIYNVEKFIRQCLDSIINQTLKDIEIILVDDGSPDNCGKICDEYALRDNRIKVIHQSNGGLGNAYNNGVAAATGEYIGFVEPDDWIEPEMYEVMYNNAKYYDTDATKCGFSIYNSIQPALSRKNKGVLGFVCNEPRGAFKIEDYELLCAYHSSIWSYIYKADFVKQIKFVETKGGAAYVDAPFGFEVLCRAKRLSIVPRCFYHWRVEDHGNSVSITDKRVIAMADRFIEAKNVLKRTGKYETLKEIFYLHARNANYGHYLNILPEYKKEYFNKLRELFGELKYDSNFKWKYLGPNSKNWIQNIYNNNFIASHFEGKNNFKDWRKFLFRIKFKHKNFIIQILGFQVSKGDFSKFPAFCRWKIGE